MRFCAFLRGVNVNGTSMKMAEVCHVFEEAGMQQVSSVLASGNILFSSELPVSDLKIRLEKAMSNHFQYNAFLFIKKEDEIASMLTDLPFQTNPDFHTYVFIGEQNVETLLFNEFNKVEHSEGEKATVSGNHFYWQIPKGITLTSDFGKILGNKHYKNLVTSRNINTIQKVSQKI